MMESRRVLLVLDDEPSVARAFCRVLRRHFDEVCVAYDEAGAETVLKRREAPVTHLLCDHYLGEGKPTGLTLVPRWRKRFPSLQLAVVVSGSEVRPLAAVAGVDRFVSKPPDIGALRAALGVS